MKLSITRAWDEAAAFVKQEAGALFLIVFALSVLPGLIVQAIAGRIVGPLDLKSGGNPDLRPLLAAMPIILLMFIPAIVLSIWGNLTVNVLALRRETVIGSAFRRAARRILPVVGASFILFLACFLLMLPAFGLLGYGITSGHVGIGLFVFLLMGLVILCIAVRLMLLSPVAAAEQVGPIGIVRRSWQLTSGHFWKLLGFILLLGLVFAVVSLVVGAVGGIVITLLAGQPTPGTLSSFLFQLITGIVQAVFATYFIVLIARIYEQLSGNAASVAQVFE